MLEENEKQLDKIDKMNKTNDLTSKIFGEE